MYKMINYFASENCPVRCGEVIYLKDKDSERVFCHCTGCGCSWADPKDAQTDVGLSNYEPIQKYAKKGITLPTEKEIVAAGFAEFIFGSCSGPGTYSAEEINEYAYKST